MKLHDLIDDEQVGRAQMLVFLLAYVAAIVAIIHWLVHL